MTRLLTILSFAFLALTAPALAETPFRPGAMTATPGQPQQFKTLHQQAQAFANDDRVYPAIAGGRAVAQGQAGYAVRLEARLYGGRRSYAFCSGSLIAARYVLTAAHCLADSVLEYDSLLPDTKFRVRFANVTGKPTVPVVRASYWRDFDPDVFGSQAQADLAVLELASDGPAEPVKVATIDQAAIDSPVRELGYGPRKRRESDGMQSTLYQGSMDFATPQACGGRLDGINYRVTPTTEFCTQARPPAANAGACHGDSGGPALTSATGALIGVTSWSLVENCDVKASKRNTVFARADGAKAWLQRQTGVPLFGEEAVAQDLTVPEDSDAWVYSMNSRSVTVATTAFEGDGDQLARDRLADVTSEAGSYYVDNGTLDGFAPGSDSGVSAEVDGSGRSVTLSTDGSNGSCAVIYRPTSRGGVNPRTYNVFCEGGSWKASTTIIIAARNSKKVYKATATAKTDATNNGVVIDFPRSWRKRSLRAISVEVYGRFYNNLDNGVSSPPDAVTLRLR